jgi:cyclase
MSEIKATHESQEPESSEISRREMVKRTAWAGAGVATAMAGLGELTNMWGQGQERVDESSPRQGWPQVKPLPPIDKRYPVMPTWKTEMKQLAPNVYVYQQQGGTGLMNAGISNGALFVGDDWAVVLDSLGFPLQSKAFLAAAKQTAGGKPITQLINSHHHGDHVAGNQFFLPMQILGHPYCRQEVLKAAPTTPKSWPKQEGLADGTEERRLVAPSVTFEDNLIYEIGGNRVEFRFMGPAHTWGDIVAYVPQHKIMFAADLAFFHLVPYAHNGWVSKWIEQVDKILKMDVDVIVPGHGPVAGKKELAEMNDYFRVLKVEAKKRYDAKMTPGRAAADIDMGRFVNLMGPERIVMNTVRLYHEFAGTLTPDVDVEGTRAAILEYNEVRGKKA